MQLTSPHACHCQTKQWLSPVQDLLLVLLVPVKAEEAQGRIPEGTRLGRLGAKAGPQLLQLCITLDNGLLQLAPQALGQLLAHIYPHLHSGKRSCKHKRLPNLQFSKWADYDCSGAVGMSALLLRGPSTPTHQTPSSNSVGHTQ